MISDSASGRRNGSGRWRGRDRTDSPIFATALDTFVGVFVQCGKVFPKVFVGCSDRIAFSNCGKLLGQISQSDSMKLVLV